MRAVRYRLRLELRSGWRACAALGLVVGIVGGAVLALAAGARRTDSAYRRFLRQQDAYDVLVSLDDDGFGDTGRAVAIARPDPALAERRGGRGDRTRSSSSSFGAGVGVLVPPDDRIGTEINRYKMLHGRQLDPRNPTEAVVSFSLADEYHVKVGSKIRILHPDVLGPIPPDAPPEELVAGVATRRRVLALVPTDTVTVVGIEASPNEFPPQIEGTGRYLIHASPALTPIAEISRCSPRATTSRWCGSSTAQADTDAFLARLRPARPERSVLCSAIRPSASTARCTPKRSRCGCSRC